MDMGSIKKSRGGNLQKLLSSKGENYWIREGEKNALLNFKRAAARVPAYKKFLKKNQINPQSIRTIKDFAHVPETNKKNYIQAYSLAERCPDGKLSSQLIVAASSGTTDKPTLWPRGVEQEDEAEMIHELIFSELYETKKYRTLLIIGFPMGVYVSGMATTLPSVRGASKYGNVSVITAGNNKEGILSLLPQVTRQFDQVILAGHPFFVKDIIESAKRQGIRWGGVKLRTFFCSEGFNETWRDYVSKLIPSPTPHKDLLSFYGSSEFLLMGYETSQSVLMRKKISKNARARERIFGASGLPALFHYIPSLRYIETNKKNELLFTAWSGIPLVKYNLRDSGKVIPYSQMHHMLSQEKIRMPASSLGWKLPYVALYGRSDHTIVFYAANIYPEHIHEALSHRAFLKKITGKFSMEKNYTTSMDQRLILHIELQEGERGGAALQNAIKKQVVETLELLNMEYLFLRKNLEKDIIPKIALHSYRDSTYFKPGLKPRYIIT